jgi:hypothetical protein
MKLKECKHCGCNFTPARPLQRACGPVCALQIGRAKTEADKAKAERASIKARKEAAKTKREWADELQVIVNKYVRLRDKDLSCCSCDRPASWGGQWHASHFRSVGAASGLRFHLWNIHKGCSICNNHKSGNLEGYRPKLIDKIGQEKVDWLYTQNGVTRYEVEYLQRFIKIMRKKVKRLEARG